jgi:hypothetical protein
MPLLEPKEVIIQTLNKDERVYIISKFPAVAGREIVMKYPLSAVPKLADYSSNEEVMLKLMCYVAIPRPSQNGIEGIPIVLNTKALVDNHVPDWETLGKLEIEMLKYNTSFFGFGELSTFLGELLKKVIMRVSPTLMPLLERLSAVAKPR